MSITYTPTTNFGSKDVLPANDPNKVIVGAEFTSEFNAIQAAFALAAPTSNPTFSGTATYNNLSVTGTFTSRGIDDNADATAITIDSNENVGIGTTSPARILHVESNGLADLMLRDTSSYSAGTGPAVIFQGKDSGETTTQFGAIYGVSNGSNSGELKFETRNSGSSAERMRIDASGNVGVDRGQSLRWYDGTIGSGNINAAIEGTGDPALKLYTRQSGTSTLTERMRIDSSGNVGIGTDNPVYLLDLQKTSPALRIKSTSTATGVIMDVNDTSGQLTFLNYNGDFVAGAFGANTAQFRTSNTERMRIDASGNVGIGTDIPDGKLSVFSGSAGSVTADADADELVLENSGNVGLSLLTTSSGESSIYFGNPGANGQKDFSLKYYHESHPDTAKRRSFTFNSPTKQLMCVNNSGNVGIGTDSPNISGAGAASTSLTVSASASNGNGILELQGTRAAGSVVSYVRSFNNNGATPITDIVSYSGATSPDTTGELAFHTSNAERMRIDALGNVGIGDSSPRSFGTGIPTLSFKGTSAGSPTRAGAISFESYSGTQGLATIYSAAGAIDFYTGPSTTDSFRMRLDSSGNLLVGSSSAVGGSTAASVQITHTASNNGLTVKNVGNARYYTHAVETVSGNYALLNDANVGVTLANGASTWSAFSDETLKENISDIGPVLDTIKDFQCVNYSLKATESEADDKVGFIAQDWEHTFPNVVTKNDEGTLSMKYTETIPVLLKAIQEQQALIEALTAKVEALENA